MCQIKITLIKAVEYEEQMASHVRHLFYFCCPHGNKNFRAIPKSDRKIAMNMIHNIGQQGNRTGERRVVGLGTEVGSARGSSRPDLSNTVATNQVGY